MNMISSARHSLGLTQVKFGEWLGEQLNKGKPIHQAQVAAFESSRQIAGSQYRDVCFPLACSVASAKIAELDYSASDYKEQVNLIISNHMR